MSKCIGIGVQECFQSTFKGSIYCTGCLISILRDENKKLGRFVDFVNEHITDTCNAGYVFTNITPEMIKKKIEELKKEK